MSTYLVVLDAGLSAQSLRYGLLNFTSGHKPTDLVLLQVPRRLPGESEEEARRAARDGVSATRSLLSTMGVPAVDAIVGDSLPRKAIAAEMNGGHRQYDGILLASKPSGFLRFLHFDLAHQLERKFHVPVAYVEPEASEDVAAA
jgi:hypothetical protein